MESYLIVLDYFVHMSKCVLTSILFFFSDVATRAVTDALRIPANENVMRKCIKVKASFHFQHDRLLRFYLITISILCAAF